MSSYDTYTSVDEPLSLEAAKELGLTADSMNQYALMAAIQKADKLITQIRATQMIHTQNMCRIANRLAAGYES